MFKRLLVLLVVFVIISPLFAEGNKEGDGETQKVYKIRFAHGLPPTHSYAKALEEFARLAEEKSDGQIVFEIYTAGQLFKSSEVYEAVKTGMLEGGNLFTVYLQPNIPVFDALAPTGTVWNREVEDEIISQYLKEEGPGWELTKAMEADGLKPLAWFSAGCAGKYSGFGGTGKPVITPADVQGKKMRGLGKLNVKALELWGGRPSYISGADLYTALQRGTIDMSYVTPTHLIERKLSEVTDWYVAGVPASTLEQFFPVVSMDYFNKLPTNLQQALVDAGRESTLNCLDLDSEFSPYAAVEENFQALVEMEGFDVIEPNSKQLTVWADQLKPVHDAWMRNIGPEAVKIYNMVSDLEKEFGLPYYYIK